MNAQIFYGAISLLHKRDELVHPGAPPLIILGCTVSEALQYISRLGVKAGSKEYLAVGAMMEDAACEGRLLVSNGLTFSALNTLLRANSIPEIIIDSNLRNEVGLGWRAVGELVGLNDLETIFRCGSAWNGVSLVRVTPEEFERIYPASEKQERRFRRMRTEIGSLAEMQRFDDDDEY